MDVDSDYQPTQTSWPSAVATADPAPATQEAAPEVRSEQPELIVAQGPGSVSSRRRTPLLGGSLRLRDLVWLVVGVVDAFLAVDFVVRALGLAQDQFVGTVERVGSSLQAPFAGLFNASTPHLGRTNDWALILALALYTIGAWIVARILTILGQPRGELA